MTQISNPKIAFAYLRPACVLLTREPTVTNVETLGGQLRELDDATLQQLQEYVLFPLRFILKLPAGSQHRERLVQSVVEAMTHVLETTCVRSWETLRDLLSELCLCLSSPADPGRPAPGVSEELKGAVLRCLSALLHAAYGDTLLRLYEPAMLPGLGAAISLLLALGEQERSREVQLAALRVVQTLGVQCDCSRGEEEHVTLGEQEQWAVGNAMASFLPGITVALTRVVTGDPRHGHAVTVSAVKVWYRTVALVMDDAQLRVIVPGETGPAGLGRVGELVVLRSPDWVKGTAGRLGVLLKRLLSCTVAHLHWRVRLETVELADHLLAHCSGSLGGECMGPLLEALVGAVNDEEPRVRKRCEAALREASERGRGGASASHATFADVLSENLHGLATSLPRVLRAADDHKKLSVLNVFLGYLKLLGPLIDRLLTSAAHLQRISKALMQVLELDVRDVRIVEERSSSSAAMRTACGSVSEDPLAGHAQRKYFLYFRDEKILSVLMEICRMLGYYGNTYLLVDHFLDLYRESSVYRKQAAMVLNETIKGAAGVGVAMWEYTSERNWNLTTVIQDHELNSNIWQLCIQLEGVACGALTLGRAFRPLLMTSLYAVLDKAGDEALLVSQAALACACGVAGACGYTSLRHLIADNSDYLLNDVSLNLHRLPQNPQAPRVLSVVLAHSDPSLLPLVGDIVQDVLLALDLSYDHTAALFCSVLHSLMKALVRWFPPSLDNPERPPSGRGESSGAEPEDMTALDVRQFLLDYSRQKELAEVAPAEEEEEEEEEGPDLKKELPAHIIITKEVLDIVELCVCILREREDELLPMVHNCWPALLRRLTDDDPLAVLRGFQVLCTLGEACGDFLRSRVSKEVLPRLGSSLTRQAPVSARAGLVYTHTLAYKLQLAVLQGLGALCLRLQLGEADLDAVCDACLPYLSCRQPINLQEACLSVFRHLIQVDPDAFWLTLSQLHCPSPYAPPHPHLQPLQLGRTGLTRDQYTHNLDRLLRDAFGSLVPRPPGLLGDG
ncbi:hypothetical protein NHX12_013276 [Muraenolepis orangiensis]|uniref:TELO2-interacting protein 1 homolog n=1 Tax=Muraenolepis orangiensis TaxID=630683 RepID=A0A9Q0I5S0_9TELE|nr:hypothetical protein NHX12_013276 [Muraenolepis orangiensis]